jgi:antitoxin HicB
MFTYPVTLTRDDGGFVVSFPDVPEAITEGDDEAEALLHAVDALETAFMAYIADRRDIPDPSPASGPTVTLPILSAAKLALYRTMRAKGIGKAELARRMGCHLPQIDRLLDLNHRSRMDQIEAALKSLGRELVIELREAA